MEAKIDQTKYNLHNWIMQNERTYQTISIKIGNEDSLKYDPYLNSTQRNLDRLMAQKKKAIELYLNETSDHDIALEYIIELNNHIKQILGL